MRRFLYGREVADLDIIGRLVVHVDEFPALLAVCPYSEWTFDAYLWVRHEVAQINRSAQTEPAVPSAVA